MTIARKHLLHEEGGDCLHIINRVVNRDFILDNEGKEIFLELVRRMSQAFGIPVLTYCIMSNHFHLLVKTPLKREVSDAELMEFLKFYYGKSGLERKLLEWENHAANNLNHLIDRDMQRLKGRLFNVSFFMQEIQQRFSRWYNKKNKRKGTLWESRYKCLLVEGAQASLSKVAAYIDLNPVRAGLVNDPMEYRFCGYAAAVTGGVNPRNGLCMVYGIEDKLAVNWDQVQSWYRRLLFGEGSEVLDPNGQVMRRGFSWDDIREVERKGGRLGLPELLRCRIRYMSDGVVIGSRKFVEEFVRDKAEGLNISDEREARKFKGRSWGPMFSFRGPVKEVYR